MVLQKYKINLNRYQLLDLVPILFFKSPLPPIPSKTHHRNEPIIILSVYKVK